ncbi:hypothetical protein RUND412_005622 [Rhizina undulata]
MAYATFLHPTLQSTLKGLSLHDGKVVQFRGIKYASIPERFARSFLVETWPSELDCTTPGPICPQARADPEGPYFNVPEEMRRNAGRDIPWDELGCLNLIVTMPAGIPAGTKLPVFCNIHGGAFRAGTSESKFIDFAPLVARSIHVGKPFVGVSINYRIHILGFGVIPNVTTGNNGLFDQRLALQWIQSHIAGFGGDPTNVTIGGESAGSISVDAHMQAHGNEDRKEFQLFKRAILESGVVATTYPLSEERQIGLVTQKFVDSLNISSDDWPETLKTMDIEELVAGISKAGLGIFSPTLDGDFLAKDYTPYEYTPSWVESIFIGDCGFEGFIWSLQVQATSPSDVTSALSPLGATAEEIKDAYNLYPSNSAAELTQGIQNLITDMNFSGPIYLTAQQWRKSGRKVYQYLFDQPNPWDSRRGAMHAIDLIYLFGNYPLDEKSTELGQQFGNDVISYVNGGEPWSTGDVRSYGPEGIVGFLQKGEHEKRRRFAAFEVLKKLGPLETARVNEAVLGALPPIGPRPTNKRYI